MVAMAVKEVSASCEHLADASGAMATVHDAFAHEVGAGAAIVAQNSLKMLHLRYP